MVNFILPLLIGYMLDLILGDPEKWPHPIKIFGNLIATGERLLNKGKNRFLKGSIMTIVFGIGLYVFFFFVENFLYSINLYGGLLFSSIFIYYGLANKNLLVEGKNVFQKLNDFGLEQGRKQLSRIVGRSTEKLNENEIRIAVLESLSENLSDGVIAPLFFYAVAGVPGMMVYKMINTLDSMIGYKSDRYFYFGKFAARLDDVVNFIPARITAILIALVSLNKKSLKFIIKFGKMHSSPNSGFPEAALAGVLNCRFGGPNTYHGQLVMKPYIGEVDRIIKHEEFKTVWYINHSVTLLFIILIIIGTLLKTRF